jgi:hypothetical protein
MYRSEIRHTQEDELELGEASAAWSAHLLLAGGHDGWWVCVRGVAGVGDCGRGARESIAVQVCVMGGMEVGIPRPKHGQAEASGEVLAVAE